MKLTPTTAPLALAAALAAGGCTFQASVSAGSRRHKATEKAPASEPSQPDEKGSGASDDGDGSPKSEAKPAEPKAEVRLKGTQLLLARPLTFQGDSASLDESAAALLTQVELYLKQNPRVTRLRIEAHTHNQRDGETSMKISSARASAIKQWLLQRGVPSERVLAVAFGAQEPIESNKTPEGQAKNERIALHLAEVDGKPYMSSDLLAGGTEVP